MTLVPPPQPGSEEELEDLLEVVSQYQNRVVPANLQRRCDVDMTGLFCDLLENRNCYVDREYVKEVKNLARPIITTLKEYFNRPRPPECAKDMGVMFESDDLDTAQSPSYPSGHTIQSYVMAGKLSDMFPEHEKELHALAEAISQSRIDRGVHYPSDVEYGKLIARQLLNQI